MSEYENLSEIELQAVIDNAAKALKVPLPVIQKWVDFLIEEEILGVEYKFVTPYLYFNKDPDQTNIKKVANDVENKVDFFKKARERGLPLNRVNTLWQKYLSSNSEEMKEEFIGKAIEKGLSKPQIDELWKKYYLQLLKVEQ